MSWILFSFNDFLIILHFLSDLFYDVVSCFAAMEVWTGCLLAGFIKPSADRYICRSDNGAASPSQLPSRRKAAKWHKTVWCCLQSYKTAHLMWKKAAAHASVRGSATDEWLQGLRGRCQSAPTPKSPRLMVPRPPHPHLLFQLSSFITRSLLIYAFLLSCHVQNIKIDTNSTQASHLWLSKVGFVFRFLKSE